MNKAPTSSDCPACRLPGVAGKELPYEMFRHLDFSRLQVPGTPNLVAQCDNCGHLFRIMDKVHSKALEKLYRSLEYAEHKESRAVRHAGRQVHAAIAQAGTVLGHLGKAPALDILDIGCFDGALLGAFEQAGRAGRLVGFDVDQRPSFAENCGGEFTTGPLGELGGFFNLILLSQSLICIENLDSLMAEIDRLLTPDGHLFVHVPDILQKAPMLLLGDQHHYFTKGTLESLLRRHGFIPEFLAADAFPRDLLLLARKGDSEATRPDPVLEDLEAALDATREQLLHIGQDLDEYTLLGTTMDAALAHSIQPGKVTAFVDEDPHKIGQTFHGKPVLAPAELKPGQHCILPFGASGRELLQRFESQYPGKFHLLETA